MSTGKSRIACLFLAALTGCRGIMPLHPVWSQKGSSNPDQPIYMLGEVRRPGSYPAQPREDLVEFVTRTHGFTATADLDRIEMLRYSKEKWHSHSFSWRRFQEAPPPMAGDVVIVHSIRQSKFERRLQIGALLASLLASVSALILAADR